MKYLSLFVTFLILSFQSYSQGEADNWYFGVFAGLNFSSSSPVPLSNGALYTTEGGSTISDSAGNLLFYTDGLTVWNNLHTAMPNGTGLNGGISSTQSALIVRQPGSDSIYYIFTTDEAGYDNGFCYSMVDLSLDAGLGDVIVKNIPLLNPSTEKLTGVTTLDGLKSWIVVHEWGTNAFRSYSLTSSGLDTVPVISNVGIVHTLSAIQNTYGQMKFASCGERIAAAIFNQDTVEVFDFNIATGEIYNPITLPLPDHVYGLEFSGNSSKLYVTCYDEDATLLQYDLSAGSVSDIIASQTILSTTPDLYALQIATDGKIYVARSWNAYVGVINFPDYGGTACDYVDAGINIDPNYFGSQCALGLPGFVQSYFDDEHKACLPTIVEEDVSNETISVYPNPSDGFVFVKMNSSLQGELHFSIYDIVGKRCLESQIDYSPVSENKINLTGFGEGVYLIYIRSGDESYVKKIVLTGE